jgi:predicted esterase
MALAVLVGASAAAAAEISPGVVPTGTVVDGIVGRSSPGESYAAYVPAAYSAGRKWPILYVFDARGRGALAARRFAEGAEARHYLVASSNQSASDGPIAPNAKALHALWADTHERFAIDDRRVYLAGYSGTARFAAFAAKAAPGAVAGIIACSGGFDETPTTRPPFLVFATTGVRDFNFREIRDLDGTLEKLGATHRTEEFDGGHEWAPVELCREALEWMDLQAMKDGTMARNPLDIEALWQKGRARAEKLVREGRPDRALRAERALASLFRGLRDVGPAESDARGLAASRATRRLLDEADRLADEERRYRSDLAPVWIEIRTPGDSLPLARLVRQLRLDALRRRADSNPGSLDGQAAARMLAEVFVQTSFYLPRGFVERSDFDRALLCLELAERAQPGAASVAFERAIVHARAGKPDDAIADLERAAERGLRSAEAIRREPAFAELTNRPRFTTLLRRLDRETEDPPA